MKLKTILSSFMAVSLLLASAAFPAEAANDFSATEPSNKASAVATKDDFIFTVSNDRITITEYIGTASEVIIPSYIDNKPVSIIRSGAFHSSKITYIKIPETVTILQTTTETDGNPFSYCDSLNKIDVHEGNPSFSSVDGVVYNKNKTLLKIFPAGRSGSFLIPYGVTAIDNFAFYRCYQLQEVNMYNTVTAIGERAFDFCWGMKNIRLSDNLQKIGKMAFAHCNDLTRLYLPPSINSIGLDAFLGRINSNDSSKEYYLVDGIYCVPGSYAAKYFKNYGLATYADGTSYTDIATGITVTDLDNKMPQGTTLKVEKKLLSSVNNDFSQTNYTDSFVYEIYFVSNGVVSAPIGNYKVSFDNISDKLIPTATKVFTSRVGDIEDISAPLSSNNATTHTDALGTFIVLFTNNFSKNGDVNGDGKITTEDARIALLAASKVINLTSAQKTAADVVTNGSDKGVITVADAKHLLSTASGI